MNALDSYAPAPRTYPGGWLVLAVLAGLIALWVPFMVLAVIGAVVLGVLKVWKVARHE